MNDKIVFFIFAGRQVNLEIQKPYLDRLLETYPNAELHYWDLTRTPEDAEYLRTLIGAHEGRVKVLDHLHPGHPIQCSASKTRRRGCTCVIHKPPYEAPYQWYAKNNQYGRHTFVKLDDDVLFIETERFDDLLVPLREHPNAVVSANVVNNVVSAKLDPQLSPLVASEFKVGAGTDSGNDKAWWWLHADHRFSSFCHDWFLGSWPERTMRRQSHWVRSRPGERISINFIAFTHRTMRRLAGMIDREPRLGDEGAVDRLLPRIATSFRVAHLTFGPQDAEMPTEQLASFRSQYADLAKAYLGE